jgi:hypothetical protein
MMNKMGIIRQKNINYVPTLRKNMILIGTLNLNKINVVSSRISSFLPSPCNRLILTRSFCGVPSALVQLSSDIEFVYNDFIRTECPLPILREELEVIQQLILNGLYILSPLHVKYMTILDLPLFLSSRLPDCPDVGINYCIESDEASVVMPSKRDVLVLMGLSVHFFRLSYGGLPEDGYRISHLYSSFYESLTEMGKVDRLYSLNLDPSLDILPINLTLSIVKRLVGDGQVYKLIHSFLKLPIIDEDGKKDTVKDRSCGIPVAGEITRVLFNIVLMDIFDREFKKRFPGVAVARWVNQVFISTKGNEKVNFDEKAGYQLLKDIGLIGEIEEIKPGKKPILIKRKMIYLDNEKKIHILDF